MVQRRSRLCLTPEAAQRLGVLGYFFGQELEGDKAVRA